MHQSTHYQTHFHADQEPNDAGQGVGHQLHLPLLPELERGGELDGEDHRVDNDSREGSGGNVGHEGAEEGDGQDDDGPSDDASKGCPHLKF